MKTAVPALVRDALDKIDAVAETMINTDRDAPNTKRNSAFIRRQGRRIRDALDVVDRELGLENE